MKDKPLEEWLESVEIIKNLRTIDCTHTADAVAKILNDEEREADKIKGLTFKQLMGIIDTLY